MIVAHCILFVCSFVCFLIPDMRDFGLFHGSRNNGCTAAGQERSFAYVYVLEEGYLQGGAVYLPYTAAVYYGAIYMEQCGIALVIAEKGVNREYMVKMVFLMVNAVIVLTGRYV